MSPRCTRSSERLCLLADLPKPELIVEPEKLPNSWVVGTRAGGYRLHLTRGLLDRLESHEVEAVIGHELAHIANRDAAVMTVVGGPGAALLGGGRTVFSGGWFAWPGAIAAMAIGWVAQPRHPRALALPRVRRRRRLGRADRQRRGARLGADEGLRGHRGDPREATCALASARDAFHLLPVARDGEDRYHLPATHPSLQARIARLEKLEHAVQRSRSS